MGSAIERKPDGKTLTCGAGAPPFEVMAMRRIVIAVVVLAVCGVGGLGLWWAHASASHQAPYRTEEVKHETLLASFTATGTLEPEDIIDVGAQVAGQIKEFGKDRSGKLIDYGSEVEAGTELALIDPSLFEAKANQSKAMIVVARAAYDQAVAKVDDAKANVNVTKANLETAKTNYDHAKSDWDRAQVLSPRQALAPADYDTYRATYQTSKAAIAQNEAAVKQAEVQVIEADAAAANAKANIGAAEAAYKQDEINLGYTHIVSPVKGVIIDRRVTIGQTVQSSFNTPSLFLLARDLRRMKVWASVNEADIGKVHVGQQVEFTVDAHPGQKFKGKVGLIRLNATMTSNVVTYTVEVLTDNAVKFHLTDASFTALRAAKVPDAVIEKLTALKDKVFETRDLFTAELARTLNTDELQKFQPQVENNAESTNGKLLPYLTANLRFEVDKRGNALTVANEALRWRPDPKQVAPEARAAFQKSAQKRDAADSSKDAGQSGPATHGVVWVPEGQFVKPVKVKLGLSDGVRTEIVGGDLKEGEAVVTGDALVTSDDSGSNPFAPQMFGGKKQQ
jgi:HlyD family secretion protein